MFEGGFTAEFEALSKLVALGEDQAHVDTSNVSRPSPASIGPKDLLNVTVPAPKPRKDPKEIWDESEVQDVVEDDIDDGRPTPEYEFMYKQSVDSADVFLGMGGKDESSTSCEEMVVKISLPGVANMKELDLDVQPTYLKLSHTAYKLSVYLPHKVDSDRGKARWDGKKETLLVTLPIIREDPF